MQTKQEFLLKAIDKGFYRCAATLFQNCLANAADTSIGIDRALDQFGDGICLAWQIRTKIAEIISKTPPEELNTVKGV